MTTIEKILEIVKAEEYSHYGLRAISEDEEYSVGDWARESYEWDFEEDCSTYETTGERAGGTCCVKIFLDFVEEENEAKEIERVLSKARDYANGGKIVLLGGRRAQ